MAELQFQQIALKDITPDPNQPRKFYEEHAMNELTQSVKESGVLQPILVRKKPKGKGYLLVCGERRYRASEAAGKKDIPAVIRELTDEEALQLQIIENLQRKDVHPMEEAVAFKSFVEGKNWSFDEIAKRVGKSEYYVKQRIKLNSLTENFQKLFFQNKMSITTALMMAQIPEETQIKIFNDNIDEDDLKNQAFVFEINKYQMNSYKGDLQNATFDINDAELVPNKGACSTCQFNSAVAKLFPDEAAKCNNIGCFKIKSNVSFAKLLEEAKEDPTIIFVTTSYGISGNDEKELKALGVEAIGRNSYDIEEKPEHPDIDDFKENLEDGDYDTEEEMMESYNEALEDYNKDLEQYEKKVASGKFKKAFVIHGNDKGKFVYIALKAKSNTKQTKATVSDEVSTEDIDSEIQRLKDKEKRSKEIDGNKVWDLVKGKFLPGKYAEEMGEPLTDLEVKALSKTMYNALGWQTKDEFRKLFKIDGRSKDFPEIDNVTFNKMCRYFFLSLLPPAYCTTGINDNQDASLCMEIAEQYFPGPLLEIQDDNALKSEKRIKRVEARIKELQEQKKELKAAQPKPTKAKK